MTKTRVGMIKFGSHLSIDVDFWSRLKTRFIGGFFTFDTGAAVTTISKSILYDLGYNIGDGKTQVISTASGTEYVKEVVIDKIRIGDIVLENILVYAHTFPDECATSGVIGLNVLSMFDINLLFSKRLIELTRLR